MFFEVSGDVCLLREVLLGVDGSGLRLALRVMDEWNCLLVQSSSCFLVLCVCVTSLCNNTTCT